jgi:KUP system potassium uptake protein
MPKMRPFMQTNEKQTRKLAQAGLALGALGVVFGDIGTSPLYTFRECLAVSAGRRA